MECGVAQGFVRQQAPKLDGENHQYLFMIKRQRWCVGTGYFIYMLL